MADKKKAAAKKPAAKKAAPKKAEAKKPAAKKAEPKKAAAKAAPAKKDDGLRHSTYVVKKRDADGMWEVRYKGGEKAIKLFRTKDEATEYTKKMAANQGSAIVFHKSKGKDKGKFSKR